MNTMASMKGGRGAILINKGKDVLSNPKSLHPSPYDYLTRHLCKALAEVVDEITNQNPSDWVRIVIIATKLWQRNCVFCSRTKPLTGICFVSLSNDLGHLMLVRWSCLCKRSADGPILPVDASSDVVHPFQCHEVLDWCPVKRNSVVNHLPVSCLWVDVGAYLYHVRSLCPFFPRQT